MASKGRALERSTTHGWGQRGVLQGTSSCCIYSPRRPATRGCPSAALAGGPCRVGVSPTVPTMTEHRIALCGGWLTLIVTGWPNRPRIINNTYHADFAEPRSSRHSAGNEITFSVNMRACDGIRLHHSGTFPRSTKLQWYEGLRIRVPYQERGPTERQFSRCLGRHKLELAGGVASLWESLVVQWDDQRPPWATRPRNSSDCAREAQPELDPDSSFARSIASVQEPVVEGRLQRTGDIEALLGSVGIATPPLSRGGP